MKENRKKRGVIERTRQQRIAKMSRIKEEKQHKRIYLDGTGREQEKEGNRTSGKAKRIGRNDEARSKGGKGGV